MIDRLFQTVQAMLDKEQKDYLRPLYFNLYLNASLFEIQNKLIADVKSNIRKSNWMLDGKNLADFSEYQKQMLEHYLTIEDNISPSNDLFALPSNCSLVQDVLVVDTNVIIEKIDLEDFNLLRRSKSSPPTETTPVCTKVGSSLLVLPKTLNNIQLFYVRTPNKANWTYQSVEGKPMFDPTAGDFVDVDAPDFLFDELVNSIMARATLSTRDQIGIQANAQEENRNMQLENRQ